MSMPQYITLTEEGKLAPNETGQSMIHDRASILQSNYLKTCPVLRLRVLSEEGWQLVLVNFCPITRALGGEPISVSSIPHQWGYFFRVDKSIEMRGGMTYVMNTLLRCAIKSYNIDCLKL